MFMNTAMGSLMGTDMMPMKITLTNLKNPSMAHGLPPQASKYRGPREIGGRSRFQIG